MTLKEISVGYEESAVLLRQRLKELRSALKSTEDPEEAWRLKRRIAELTPMLTECNALAELCEHYYEKGYFRKEDYCFPAGKLQKHISHLGSEDMNGKELGRKRGDLYSN